VKPPVIELEATEIAASEAIAEPQPAQAEAAPEARASTETTGEPAATATPEDEVAGRAAEGEAASRPHSHRGRLAAGAIVVLVAAAAGGAWLYREYAASLFPPREAVEARQAIESRLSALEGAQGRLEASLNDLAAKGEAASLALSAVGGEVKALAGEVGKLGQDAEAREAAAGALAERVAALDERLGRSATEVEGLKAALAAVRAALASGEADASGKAQLGELLAGLETLGQRLSVAEAGLAAARQEIGALGQRLEEVARRDEALAPGGRAARLAAAFGALERAIAEGRPFRAELDALYALDPNLPGREALADEADAGVASLAALQSELEAALAAAGTEATARAEGGEEGWAARLKARFFSIVKVRKVGEVDWPSAGDAARGALARGDLAAAIAAFGPAGEAMPAPIARWLAAAKAREQALAALAALSPAVFAAVKRSAS
jgi:hypothetical protein